MDFIYNHLLTLILFTPVLAAVILLLTADGAGKPDPLDSLCAQPDPADPVAVAVVQLRPQRSRASSSSNK